MAIFNSYVSLPEGIYIILYYSFLFEAMEKSQFFRRLIPEDLQAAIPLGRIQGSVGQQAAENFPTIDPVVDGLWLTGIPHGIILMPMG